MSEPEIGGEIDPDLIEPAPEPPPPYAGEPDEPDWGDPEPEPEAPGIDPSELPPYPDAGVIPRDEEEYLPTDEEANEPSDPGEPELEPEPPQEEPPDAGEPDEPDWGEPDEEPVPDPGPEPQFPDDEADDEDDTESPLIGEPFAWEADPEPQGEEIAVRGETVISYDDAAEMVTITGPDGESETRAYEAPEQTRRAASIFATKLRAQLEQTRAELETQLGEMQANLDAATEIIEQGPRSITVSHRDPTAADAEGRPDGALWEVRSEPEHGPVVTLRRWYLIRGAWVQTEVMGNLIVPGTIDADKVRMNEAWANQIAANIGTFQSAFVGKLSAQMIQAETFDGYEVRGAKIVSPGKAGDITITDNTITSSRFDESGELSETMTIGGSEGDAISLTPAPNEPPTVIISGNGGNASFSGDVAVNDLLIGDESLAEQLSRLPRGMLGWTWGSGASLPDIGRGAYGIVRFVWPIEKYRKYKLSGNVIFQGTAGDVVEFNFYSRADEEHTAYLGSPQVGMHRFQIPVGGVGSAHIEHLYSENFDFENYSALISMRNWSAPDRPVRLWSDGGSDRSQSQFWLEDLGPSTNAADIEWHDGGGSPFKPPSAPAPPPPPPPPRTKRTYTRTYKAAQVRSWRGSGTVGDVLGHGTYGGYKRVSQILFPPQVHSDLAGASIKSVKIRLRNLHTYAGSGMQVYLAPSGHQSLAGSPPGSLSNTVTRSWGKGQTKWETLSGWSSSSQSVWLGVGAPGSGTYYGKFSRALSDCVLQVTYEK